MSMQPSKASSAIRIDAHAHVFDGAGRLAENRRYTPLGPRPAEDYLTELDAAGITHALLVQPSFLGTDNRYLLQTLAAEPGRFRGVAVVDPEVTDAEMTEMKAQGVVGLRYNLIGDDPASMATAPWQSLSSRAAQLGWHLEVQAEGRDIPRVLPTLLASGAPVVVDHFGRPAADKDLQDPGFQALLSAAREGAPLWVKLSGPYRCGGADMRPYAERLMETLGPNRLMWGSDWPWTRHESGKTYDQCLAWLGDWVGDAATQAAILAAPAGLMGLSR